MNRIAKAYEVQFRILLRKLGARKLEKGVGLLMTQPAKTSSTASARLLSRRCQRLGYQVKRWKLRTASGEIRKAGPRRFICDAGLGGLARWLRAAGHEAFWFPDIDDAELLRRAHQLQAIVLTTDSLMMERGILRDGQIPSLWLPPVFTIREQLEIVFQQLELGIFEPRCMRCGGELARVPKETVRDQIPPKTWLWINEYFLCRSCKHLFWQGTHWQRVRQTLDQLTAGQTRP